MAFAALLIRLSDGVVTDIHMLPDAGDGVSGGNMPSAPQGHKYRRASKAPGVGCDWIESPDGSFAPPIHPVAAALEEAADVLPDA